MVADLVLALLVFTRIVYRKVCEILHWGKKETSGNVQKLTVTSAKIHEKKKDPRRKNSNDKRNTKSLKLRKYIQRYREQKNYFAMKLNFQGYLLEKEYQKRIEHEDRAKRTTMELNNVKEELKQVPINKNDLKSKVEHLERQLFCVMHRFKEIEKEVLDLKGSEGYLKDEISIFMSENTEYRNLISKYNEEGRRRFNRDKEILKELNDLSKSMDNDNSEMGKCIIEHLRFKLEESIIEFMQNEENKVPETEPGD